MTAPGKWIHIAGEAWERYDKGVQYTLHKESDQWIVRRYSLNYEGGATKDVEESAPTIDEGKDIVDRWVSKR